MSIIGIRLRPDLVERQEPESGVTFMPNAALADDQLGLSARGLLLEILSFGNDWDIEKARAQEVDRHQRGFFEEYVDILLVELENAGYLTIVRG